MVNIHILLICVGRRFESHGRRVANSSADRNRITTSSRKNAGLVTTKWGGATMIMMCFTIFFSPYCSAPLRDATLSKSGFAQQWKSTNFSKFYLIHHAQWWRWGRRWKHTCDWYETLVALPESVFGNAGKSQLPSRLFLNSYLEDWEQIRWLFTCRVDS
jgi:hypothetical protein